MSDRPYQPSPVERQLERVEESVDLVWCHFYERLAAALRVSNSGGRQATERTYRQLLVAVLRGRRYERARVAELVGCSPKTVERDLDHVAELLGLGGDGNASAAQDEPGEDVPRAVQPRPPVDLGQFRAQKAS